MQEKKKNSPVWPFHMATVLAAVYVDKGGQHPLSAGQTWPACLGQPAAVVDRTAAAAT
jgi:hypothetical protein